MAHFIQDLLIAVAISVGAKGASKLIFWNERGVAILWHSLWNKTGMRHQHPNIKACPEGKCSRVN